MTIDEFHGAVPFDLWDIVPPSLAMVIPNVMWSRDRLHRIVMPVVTLPINELRWQLDLPWWRVDRPFTVRPNQVRHEPRTYARHWQRTLDAELRFPIHLLQRDRLIILDGVHRLLKADVQDLQRVSAHVVSHALFMDHIVERVGLSVRPDARHGGIADTRCWPRDSPVSALCWDALRKP